MAPQPDPLFLAHLLGGIEWTAGVVEGGGDCVTFPEVASINEAVATDAGVRGDKLSAGVARYLAEAQADHEAGRHAEAVEALTQAKGKAHGLQDASLVAKIADLIEWQEGLVGF